MCVGMVFRTIVRSTSVPSEMVSTSDPTSMAMVLEHHSNDLCVLSPARESDCKNGRRLATISANELRFPDLMPAYASGAMHPDAGGWHSSRLYVVLECSNT
jgi:hypothetical protein